MGDPAKIDITPSDFSFFIPFDVQCCGALDGLLLGCIISVCWSQDVTSVLVVFIPPLPVGNNPMIVGYIPTDVGDPCRSVIPQLSAGSTTTTVVFFQSFCH